MTALALGSLRVLSVRLLHPWRGAWVADVQVDPDDDADVPASGRVTLTIGEQTLSGTVDARSSGRFAGTFRVRVVAGAGGWDAPVPAQLFHSDAGVSSTRVYQATAAVVGESINDAAPVTLGIDFARTSGPASRVFGDRDWYVDLAGTTNTGARPSASQDETTEVLSYDPAAQRMELASDAVVMPGTVLTDARFDGALTIRTVEQSFTAAGGARATAWCSNSQVDRLMAALTTLVRELSGRTHLKTYRYRFVSQAPDGRLTIQAVDKPQGMPDGGPITVWPGIAGASAKYTPGQLVRVVFFDGDPTMPVVVGADGTLPLEASIDATNKVKLGAGGKQVAFVGGTVAVYPPAVVPIFSPVGAPLGTAVFASPFYGTIQDGSKKVETE